MLIALLIILAIAILIYTVALARVVLAARARPNL